jgi:hypothetical protein
LPPLNPKRIFEATLKIRARQTGRRADESSDIIRLSSLEQRTNWWYALAEDAGAISMKGLKSTFVNAGIHGD